MASPQCENGYTKIANELLDEIIRRSFSERELTLLLCVIRNTYGWGRKDHRMSGSYLSQGTGIPETHIWKIRSQLLKKNVLVITRGNLGLQKDHTLWEVLYRGRTESVLGQKVSYRTESVLKTRTESVPQQRKKKVYVVYGDAMDIDMSNTLDQHLLQWWGAKEGRPSAAMMTQWLELLKEHGREKVYEAVKIAAEQEKKSYKYVLGILNNNGVKNGTRREGRPANRREITAEDFVSRVQKAEALINGPGNHGGDNGRGADETDKAHRGPIGYLGKRTGTS